MRTKSSKARPILYILLFIFLFLCEFVFTPLYLFGICPRYILCGVVGLAMYENEKYASIFGLVFGLLSDFASGGLFGFNAIVYILAGYLVSYFVAGTWRKNFLNATISVCLVTIICDTLTLLISMLQYDTGVVNIWGVLGKIMLPKLMMTAAVHVFIYFLIKKIATNKKWRSYDEIYY